MILINITLKWLEHIATSKDVFNDRFIQPSTCSEPVIYAKVQVHMHVAVPLSKVPRYLTYQPQLHQPPSNPQVPGDVHVPDRT